jgi:hypothetical protein
VIRGAFAAHGFDEIETPVVEDVERLHSGLGGDNEKLSFSILKRGLDGDDLAVRRLVGTGPGADVHHAGGVPQRGRDGLRDARIGSSMRVVAGADGVVELRVWHTDRIICDC